MREKGSYLEWDQIWSMQSSEDLLNPMYTESDPTTIFQFWQKAYAKDLFNLIEDRGYTSFCELGSGRGTTSMYLAKKGYSDITLVDLSERAFKVASFSFNHYDIPKPRMLFADAENTGLATESFDCIYNIGLLEHFEDPTKVLEESFRLLKPGGMIFMPIVPKLPYSKSVQARIFLNPISLLKYFVKLFLQGESRSETGVYRSDLSRKVYFKTCTSIGFSDVECISYNPFWKINQNKWFEKKLTLPTYKFIYNTLMSKRKITLKTKPSRELCYLLIGYRNHES